MDNLVSTPIMYQSNEFYEFNRTQWCYFPMDNVPPGPPVFSGAGVEILYRITPNHGIVFLLHITP